MAPTQCKESNNFLQRFELRKILIYLVSTVGLSEKNTCLRGLEAVKLHSHKAKINCGLSSTISYKQSLEAENNFINKIQFSRFLGFKEIRFYNKMHMGNIYQWILCHIEFPLLGDRYTIPRGDSIHRRFILTTTVFEHCSA